jgi:hypothetical protein
LHARSYTPPANNQTKKIFMANAQRAESADQEQTTSFSKTTLAAKVKHGNVEIAIWPNEGTNGTFYMASFPVIRHQDDKGDFKDGSSFGRHDLLNLSRGSPRSGLEDPPPVVDKSGGSKPLKLKEFASEGSRFRPGALFLCRFR